MLTPLSGGAMLVESASKENCRLFAARPGSCRERRKLKFSSLSNDWRGSCCCCCRCSSAILTEGECAGQGKEVNASTDAVLSLKKKFPSLFFPLKSYVNPFRLFLKKNPASAKEAIAIAWTVKMTMQEERKGKKIKKDRKIGLPKT